MYPQFRLTSLCATNGFLAQQGSTGVIHTPKFFHTLIRRYEQLCDTVHPKSDPQEKKLGSSVLFAPLFFGGAEIGILAVIAVGLFIANFFKSTIQSSSLLPGPRNERAVSESSSSWGLEYEREGD